MKYFLFFLGSAFSFQLNAQPKDYSVKNAHSHNDYEQPVPFTWAYQAKFGSMEADIFLVGDSLYVAHDTRELSQKRSLWKLYLEPLMENLKKNNGDPYPDRQPLQMLIDLKSAGVPTLGALVRLLQSYPSLIQTPRLQWVITGNRPPAAQFGDYPAFIHFDGELHLEYNAAALSRISMLSDDFQNYSHWKGDTSLPAKDREVLQRAIQKAHSLGKPVRFWDAPDRPQAWSQFMILGVDFINTDHIQDLAKFLSTHS